MFGRTRFQQGSLQRERRKKGPEVWIFRWYEPTPDGRRKRQYRVIGTGIGWRRPVVMEAKLALQRA
jgi:integrase